LSCDARDFQLRRVHARVEANISEIGAKHGDDHVRQGFRHGRRLASNPHRRQGEQAHQIAHRRAQIVAQLPRRLELFDVAMPVE
jgi:hypothetical protein